jgi:hypothetical protein
MYFNFPVYVLPPPATMDKPKEQPEEVLLEEEAPLREVAPMDKVRGAASRGGASRGLGAA